MLLDNEVQGSNPTELLKKDLQAHFLTTAEVKLVLCEKDRERSCQYARARFHLAAPL